MMFLSNPLALIRAKTFLSSSKENKMLPKQVRHLQPVGLPMRLVFFILLSGNQLFTTGCQPGPQDNYVTFFGKAYTNDDPLFVRKLTDSKRLF